MEKSLEKQSSELPGIRRKWSIMDSNVTVFTFFGSDTIWSFSILKWKILCLREYKMYLKGIQTFSTDGLLWKKIIVFE